jgi:uncharacterized membrane protein
MRVQKILDSRIAAFSDGVIAVVITIMVLDLKAPEVGTFTALWSLWPTVMSYAVSYLFIAIVWVNHHHLLQLAHRTTSRLIWTNFAHLFAVSLVPFTTAWVARTELAMAPVVVYGAVFVGVNLAYRMFESEVLKQVRTTQMCLRMRRMLRRRSLSTLVIFATAALVSVAAPFAGFGMIFGALLLYLRPDAPGRWRFHWRTPALPHLK